MRQKESPGGQTGAKAEGGWENLIAFDSYCTPYPMGLSSLLDQALSKWEHHLSLAQFHVGEARKHRKVLRSLQSLIPPQRRGKGGAA